MKNMIDTSKPTCVIIAFNYKWVECRYNILGIMLESIIMDSFDYIDGALEEILDDNPNAAILHQKYLDLIDRNYNKLQKVVMPTITNLTNRGYILTGARALGDDMVLIYEHGDDLDYN